MEQTVEEATKIKQASSRGRQHLYDVRFFIDLIFVVGFFFIVILFVFLVLIQSIVIIRWQRKEKTQQTFKKGNKEKLFHFPLYVYVGLCCVHSLNAQFVGIDFSTACNTRRGEEEQKLMSTNV